MPTSGSSTFMLMVPISVLLGDVIELVGSSDNGLLEGVLRGATGLFSRDVVQVRHCRGELRICSLGLAFFGVFTGFKQCGEYNGPKYTQICSLSVRRIHAEQKAPRRDLKG
jgi:hypothetical protein